VRQGRTIYLVESDFARQQPCKWCVLEVFICSERERENLGGLSTRVKRSRVLQYIERWGRGDLYRSRGKAHAAAQCRMGVGR